ncbi:MAG TPA: pyridoxal-dependent decarboxylase [Thermoanaerobaculia bacterium]|jgi:aromatic-L-amino-acid decarboxylase
MPKVDPNTEEFRAAGHRLIDWIADYFDSLERYPALSPVQPGDIKRQFAPSAPEAGRPYDALIADFETKILPGITHWSHPSFFAYFPNTNSQAGVLAELLCAAVNANGMLWRTSPSLTEVEMVVLQWLREALGLPDGLFATVNETASLNVFLVLAAARERLGLEIRTKGTTGRGLPPLKVYCSEETHSSVEKGAVALGVGQNNVVKIPTDEVMRMRPDALDEAIRRDRAAGAIPCAVVATAGTTSTVAVDPIPAIGEIARREGCWFHVDAAYAGSAAVCPEFRFIWDGVEHADSIIVNPHKWLMTPMEFSVLFTRHPDVFRQTFSLVPEYLTTTDTAEVNLMDFGISLGRRFRALKLWLEMEHYGLGRMREVVRDHVRYAQRLAAEIERRDDYELLAPQSFGVVVFHKKSGDADTMSLMARMNESGKLYLSHTKVRGRYGIRVAIGSGATEWRHVEQILELL